MVRFFSARRLWILAGLVGILFAIIAYQLFQLSIIRRASLNALAQKQHHLTVNIPAIRGAIIDRTGKELASNLKVPSVFAVPRLLGAEEKLRWAQRISVILDLDSQFIEARLSKNKAFVWLKRKVSESEASAIRSLRDPAFGILEEYKRFYPQGDLAAHILGFTDIDNHGIEGVELAFNRELEGRSGSRVTKRDAHGHEIKAFEEKMIPAVNGHRVILTLDLYLQYLTERALERAYKQWKAKGAAAVLMDPNTGRILAMANRPTYDPNHASKSNPDVRRNRAVTDMFEPGSVFKIVAASAALNEGAATLGSSFFCENGTYRYGSRVLRDVHKYGQLSFPEVIIKSSNIGTVKIAALLKPEVFHRYIREYGFSQRSEFELPGEAAGFVRPPSQWSKTSPYNIPMGHEVLVTALQMVRAFAVIANGGNLVKPYFISEIQDQAGIKIREVKPRVIHRVLKPEVASAMRQILERVVDEGTGKQAKIDRIPVGGKTGTAQKVLPGGRGYSHDSFISSFIGFAPVEHPELVLGVVLDDPKPRYYGGTVAAPAFKEVIEPGLIYLGYVPRDSERIGGETAAVADVPDNLPMPL